MPSQNLGGPSEPSRTPWQTIYATIQQSGRYKCALNGDILHLASERDAQGTPNPLVIDEVLTLSNDAREDLRAAAMLAKFEFSPYTRRSIDHPLFRMRRLVEDAIGDIQAIANRNEWTPKAWELVHNELALATPQSLPKLLLDGVVPTFFNSFSDGRLFILRDNYEAEERFSIMRLTRAAVLLPFSEWNNTIPGTLSAWQTFFGSCFVANYLRLFTVLTFPYIIGRVRWSPGIWLVFQDDMLDKASHKRDIQSSADTLVTHGGIGAIERQYEVRDESFLFDEETLFQKQIWSWGTSQSSSLIRWGIDRANRLATELGCLENFAVPHGRPIDISLAYEINMTIDRCVRRAILIQSSRPEYMTKSYVFEIADQLSEIRAILAGTKPANEFKRLFARSQMQLLKDCWTELPAIWRNRFDLACDHTYTSVYDAAMDSVWTRRTGDGVNMSHNEQPNIEGAEQFVPSLIRDLRNTHHGYSPSVDKQNRRLRLLLSSGSLSPSIYFLPSLWLTALLGDPAKFLGWPAGVWGC